MSPLILDDIFPPRVTPYKKHHPVSFKKRNFHYIFSDTETLAELGRNIWSLIPHEIRQTVSFGDFKPKIEK